MALPLWFWIIVRVCIRPQETLHCLVLVLSFRCDGFFTSSTIKSRCEGRAVYANTRCDEHEQQLRHRNEAGISRNRSEVDGDKTAYLY